MLRICRRGLPALAGAALAAALSLALTGEAFAQRTLKFAHVYEKSEAYHKWAVWAADEIAKRTNGRYKIEVFPSGSLGNEQDIAQGLNIGATDIVYMGAAFAARAYPPIAIAEGPFIFRDQAHFDAFAKSDLFKEMAAGYDKATGNHAAAVGYFGARDVSANKPIIKPDDMKGLKIRLPEAPLYIMFAKSVGANATPVALGELYLALQQKVVDAQETPLPTVLARKLYEVQSDFSLTDHIYNTLTTVVSGSVWKSLSDDDKKTFDEVLKAGAAGFAKDIRAEEETAPEKLRALGKQVHKVDREAFREAAMKLHNQPGVPWTKDIYDRLEAIK